MVFVRIDKQFGRNATHHGCIEGGHCLVGKNAEVLLSVDAEDRGVPFVDEEMRGVGKKKTRILILTQSSKQQLMRKKQDWLSA